MPPPETATITFDCSDGSYRVDPPPDSSGEVQLKQSNNGKISLVYANNDTGSCIAFIEKKYSKSNKYADFCSYGNNGELKFKDETMEFTVFFHCFSSISDFDSLSETDKMEVLVTGGPKMVVRP